MEFIKIFDKELAEALAADGFFYNEEKYYGNEVVYVFEQNEAVKEKITALMNTENFSKAQYIIDDAVRF